MIKIYTTSSCHYCHKARELFKEHGIPYEEIDLIGNSDAQKLIMEKTMQFGVPVVEYDGQFMVGYNPSKLMELINSLQKK